MPAADLTLRTAQTTALTATQVDGNFTTLRDFANGLETLYNTSFNQDGTLANPLEAKNLKSDAVYYAADTGTTDDYIVELTPAITAYVDGMVVAFKAVTKNTGAASLNVNSVGAKPLTKRKDVALDDGDIIAGQIVEVRYDSTLEGFQVISPLTNQVGLPLGEKGQELRINTDGKLEFYTPTIAEAEFYPHANPYWFVAHKDTAYGTDKIDPAVTVTIEAGTAATWDDTENLFKDLGSDLIDATLPAIDTHNNNHKYADLVYDSPKFKTAGGGEDVNESSGLFILCQSVDSDNRIHCVSVYNTTLSKYIPIHTFETGDPKYSDSGVHTSFVSVPRMESSQFRIRVAWSNSVAVGFGVGFKIIGHY